MTKRPYGQFREGGYGRFTRAQIVTAVRASTSFSAVLLKLGMNPRMGSAHSALKKRILDNGISTTHFLTPAQRAIGSKAPNRKKPEEVLTLKPKGSPKLYSKVRRRALLETGVLEQCVDCGGGTLWNGKPLRLQIDHVNGNNLDDRPKNLKFRCPNCHSQTPTFGNTKMEGQANWRWHPARTGTNLKRS